MTKISMKLAMVASLAISIVDCNYQSTYHPITTSSLDPSSFANVDFIRTIDFNLSMQVFFEDPVIHAVNTLTLNAVQDTSEIILDFQGLSIESASYMITGVTDPTVFIDAYYET